MKSKTKLVAPILSLMALVVTSCSGELQGQGDDPLSGKEVTINFMTNIYNDGEVKMIEDIIAKFEAKYTNINVEYTKSGQYYQIDEELNKLLATPDRLPNMAVCYPDYVVGYMSSANHPVLDMAPYMENEIYGYGHDYLNNGKAENDTVLSDVNKQFLDEGRNYSEEGTFSLPWYKNSEALFYNYDVLNDVLGEGNYNLTNWEDIIAAGRKLLNSEITVYQSLGLDDENNAYYEPKTIEWQKGVKTPIGYDSNDNLYITFSEMMGIPYTGNEDLNKDGHINKSEAVLFYDETTKTADPNAVKLVEMLKSWYDEGLITTTEMLAKNTNNPNDGIWNYYQYSQESLIYINGSKNAQYCAFDSFRGDVLPTPVIDKGMIEDGHMTSKKGNSKAMSQGANIVFFDHDPAENLASWLFYKFLTNTENSASTAVSVASMPVRSSSYDTDTMKTAMSEADNFPENKPTFTPREENDGTYSAVGGNEDLNVPYLNAKVYEIYQGYDKNGQTFIAPLSTFSANARTQISNLLLNVFASSLTGDKLTDYIEAQFAVAYENC